MAKTAKRAGLAATGIAAGLAYAGPLRRWMRAWGATEDERGRALPGDHILSGDVDQTTRAISIHAPPEAIWPWLAQMGDRRAGFYAGEKLFRLLGLQHGHSAEKVEPQLQDLHEGDRVPAGWTGFEVRRADPNHVLVLYRSGRGYEYVWTLALESTSEQETRLLSRVCYRGSRAIFLVAEPLVFAWERQWLTGVKQRAERGARPAALDRTGAGPTAGGTHA